MKSAVPYLPLGWELLYVPEDDEFMMEAQQAAMVLSTDAGHPTGAIVVKDGAILGRGANRSLFHQYVGCVRKGLRNFFTIPSGKMYWTCYGCSPKFHAEQSAILDAKRNGHDLKGADLYLWGHWWCCESCWEKMIDAEIGRVFLVEGAGKKFKG
jgi:deoxycytidylate deaminase